MKIQIFYCETNISIALIPISIVLTLVAVGCCTYTLCFINMIIKLLLVKLEKKILLSKLTLTVPNVVAAPTYQKKIYIYTAINIPDVVAPPYTEKAPEGAGTYLIVTK